MDYKKIADGDPGGDLTTAFLSMKAETVEESRGEYRITYMVIASKVGLAQSAALESQLNLAIEANLMPNWIKTSLETDGINVNDPQVVSGLASLIGSNLTQDYIDEITALGLWLVDVYPGLREGHLQNARQKRAEGLV